MSSLRPTSSLSASQNTLYQYSTYLTKLLTTFWMLYLFMCHCSLLKRLASYAFHLILSTNFHSDGCHAIFFNVQNIDLQIGYEIP